MGARRFIPPAWAAAWGLGFFFALLALCLPQTSYRLEYSRIKNKLGMPLRVIVYYPQPPKFAPAPAAVVAQPVNDSPEYGRMLDLELVRDGFVVLTFNWRGEAPEEDRQTLTLRTKESLRADLMAAVAHLRALPEVDPARVVLAGHSVGGSLVIETGMSDPKIAAVASLGMEADVTPTSPPNLLWVVGLYDEFRGGLNHMRQVFRESAQTAALEGTTVGDFSRGTARRLGVSPTSDHFTELQDREIQRQVLAWFRKAVGLPAESRSMWVEARSLALTLAWMAGIAGLLLTFRRFAFALPRRLWVLRGILAAALLAIAGLTEVRDLDFLQATNGILALFIFALAAGIISALDEKTWERALRLGVRAGLVLWASLLATFVANNIPYYIHSPRYLLLFPEFAFRHLLDLADGYGFSYPRPLMFSVYSPREISLRWWVYAIVAVLMVFPDLPAMAVALLRRPRSPKATTRKPLPVVSVVVLIVLVVFLASVVSLRLQQGFLTGESAREAARYILQFTVLPFFVFALLWRWTGRTGASNES